MVCFGYEYHISATKYNIYYDNILTVLHIDEIGRQLYTLLHKCRNQILRSANG